MKTATSVNWMAALLLVLGLTANALGSSGDAKDCPKDGPGVKADCPKANCPKDGPGVKADCPKDGTNAKAECPKPIPVPNP